MKKMKKFYHRVMIAIMGRYYEPWIVMVLDCTLHVLYLVPYCLLRRVTDPVVIPLINAYKRLKHWNYRRKTKDLDHLRRLAGIK